MMCSCLFLNVVIRIQFRKAIIGIALAISIIHDTDYRELEVGIREY